jgi:REP element-mobilizing transposase RayT
MDFVFPNRQSHRLKSHNYWHGWYFVTICTKEFTNYFGKVVGWKVILNKIGKIVYSEIGDMVYHRDCVYIDEFVVMPNHIHMIIVIDGDGGTDVPLEHPLWSDVSTKRPYGNPESSNPHQYYSQISPQSKSLGNIIKLFKSYTSKQIHQLWYIWFEWHNNYHDRIIRDQNALHKIRQYIHNNPNNRHRDTKNHGESP